MSLTMGRREEVQGQQGVVLSSYSLPDMRGPLYVTLGGTAMVCVINKGGGYKKMGGTWQCVSEEGLL